jgi:hypothetical protein
MPRRARTCRRPAKCIALSHLRGRTASRARHPALVWGSRGCRDASKKMRGFDHIPVKNRPRLHSIPRSFHILSLRSRCFSACACQRTLRGCASSQACPDPADPGAPTRADVRRSGCALPGEPDSLPPVSAPPGLTAMDRVQSAVDGMILGAVIGAQAGPIGAAVARTLDLLRNHRTRPAEGHLRNGRRVEARRRPMATSSSARRRSSARSSANRSAAKCSKPRSRKS